MTHHIITITAPAPFVSSNKRYHWAAKNHLMQTWKKYAAWHASAQHIPNFRGRVHITATVHRDHNRGRWDVHNLADTAKAAVDGLVLAGVLVDDSNKYVEGPDMRAGEPWADAALVLTITEIGDVA